MTTVRITLSSYILGLLGEDHEHDLWAYDPVINRPHYAAFEVQRKVAVEVLASVETLTDAVRGAVAWDYVLDRFEAVGQ